MERVWAGADLNVPCWAVSKYLVPVERPRSFLRTCRAPSAWVDVEQLAAMLPESVDVRQLAAAERLRPLRTLCFSGGRRTECLYPASQLDAETVTTIKNGRAFGRQCTVLSPGGEWAVRESGYFHSWEHLRGRRRTLLSQLSPAAWRRRWETDITRRRRLPGVRRLDACAAVLNLRCSGNYYHWLTEVVGRAALVQRAGIRPDYYLVDCHTAAQRAALAYIGIEESQLIQPHFGLTLEARELILPALPERAGQRALRHRLLSAHAATSDPSSVPFPRRVYISRRNAGTRRLKNEQAVADMLTQRGFETHCLEECSFAQQIEIFQSARTIVATHGAGLANLLVARPDAKVVEIVYPGRYNNQLFPRLSECVGLEHVQVAAPRSAHKQILRPELDDIAAAIDYVEAGQRGRHGAAEQRRRAA